MTLSRCLTYQNNAAEKYRSLVSTVFSSTWDVFLFRLRFWTQCTFPSCHTALHDVGTTFAMRVRRKWDLYCFPPRFWTECRFPVSDSYEFPGSHRWDDMTLSRWVTHHNDAAEKYRSLVSTVFECVGCLPFSTAFLDGLPASKSPYCFARRGDHLRYEI